MKTSPYYINEQFLSGNICTVVVGAGGSGSEILDGLCRVHFGLAAISDQNQQLNVSVFDPDTVSSSNIGRQRFSPSDVGSNKAIQLVNRINLFYGLNWNAYPNKFKADTHVLDKSTRSTGLLITCTDKAQVRYEIGEYYRSEQTDWLWLDLGNATSTGQVVLGHLGQPTSGYRLPNIYDLYPELADSQKYDQNDVPSCSLADALSKQELFINRTMADTALNLLWKLFKTGKLEQHGAFVDLDKGVTRPLIAAPSTWEFMGYAETNHAEETEQ